MRGGKERLSGRPGADLRVATEFPHITRTYYTARSRDIDIIRLHGSIEIAPILDLTDVIVDIVETGTTLRENDLTPIETIVPISARLIANKVSFQFKHKAIQTLYDADGINFDASIAGGDEITLFRNGTLQMAFCWNIAQQLNSDNNDAGLTNDGDEIMPMAFPTASGDPKLCGGIWGFGVFDNGDEPRSSSQDLHRVHRC